jgi:hypothetical protein
MQHIPGAAGGQRPRHFAALQQDAARAARLMLALPQCLAWPGAAADPGDVADIREPDAPHHQRARLLDLERFDIARFENPPAPANAPRALASAAELLKTTPGAWLAALASSGRDLCVRHLPGDFADLPACDTCVAHRPRTLAWGCSWSTFCATPGPTWPLGRCYFPADELAQAPAGSPAEHDAATVRPTKGRRLGQQLLLRLFVPAAPQTCSHHRVLCLLPRGG